MYKNTRKRHLDVSRCLFQMDKSEERACCLYDAIATEAVGEGEIKGGKEVIEVKRGKSTRPISQRRKIIERFL